ncbi:MAG: glutathione-regulated potassium-efflux system ancillary protein KefG [Gammaproteobacteria bacterium]|jgi:glutathione-regulated potassium-efflux system ancillary protein KefG
MTQKILILFAHPSQHRSEVNLPLFDASLSDSELTVVDLYGEYPCYNIDVEIEQTRLKEHDVIIFMFPVYWYSTPAILKEWQDLVLEYGFAYGQDGTALHGKTLMCAITAGGAENAYDLAGYNHYTMRELLRPIEQTACLCGMSYVPPFTLFGARTAVDENRIESHIEQWRSLLSKIKQGYFDQIETESITTLNEILGEAT